MKATGVSTANDKEGKRQVVKKMPVVGSSIVSKIGYMLQYRGLPTTVVSINAGFRIHRHNFSQAQVLKNIGKQDITLDKEMMAECNCQIKTPTVRQSYGRNEMYKLKSSQA